VCVGSLRGYQAPRKEPGLTMEALPGVPGTGIS